jgi:hypothetical protein
MYYVRGRRRVAVGHLAWSPAGEVHASGSNIVRLVRHSAGASFLDPANLHVRNESPFPIDSIDTRVLSTLTKVR